MNRIFSAHADSAKKVPLRAFRKVDLRSSHAHKTWPRLRLNLFQSRMGDRASSRKVKYVALRRPVERNRGRTKSVINHTDPAPDYNTIKSISEPESEAIVKYCKVELTFAWTSNQIGSRSWFFLAYILSVQICFVFKSFFKIFVSIHHIHLFNARACRPWFISAPMPRANAVKTQFVLSKVLSALPDADKIMRG